MRMSRTTLTIFVVALLFLCRGAHGCNCEYRRGVLVEFYHATNGHMWNRTWDVTNNSSSVCDWPGIVCMGVVPDVTQLLLSQNQLSGTLPASLAALTRLTWLEMSSNNITGTLPPEYSAWTSMSKFYLAGNRLRGELPANYSAWGASVKEFTVSTNSITGVLPESYSAWVNVVWLSVGNNQLSGTLPTSYRAWLNIFQLSIFSNRLTGTLPSEYYAWTLMSHLYAHNNSFTGTLPAVYSEWSSMMVMELYMNQLTGPLPPQYGAWVSMTRINVGLNKLSGTLPSSYSAWTGIDTFVATKNNIEGNLPESYAAWVNVTSFIVAHNSLQGQLPGRWGAWRGLGVLMLDNNENLAGTIPASWPYGMITPGSGYISLCSTSICSNGGSVATALGRFGIVGYACPDNNADIVAAIATKRDLAIYFASSVLSSTLGNCSNVTTPPTPMPTTPSPPPRSAASRPPQGHAAVGPLVAVGIVASALASIGTVHTSSLQFALAATTLRSRCAAVSSPNATATAPLMSTAVENPTQLPVTSLGDDLEYVGGAVLGNVVLMVVVGVLLDTIARCVLPRVLSATSSLSPSSLAVVVRAAAEFFGEALLPGTLATMYSSLVTPIVTGAVVLLMIQQGNEGSNDAPPSGGAVVLSVFGLMSVLLLPIFVVWHLAATRPFPVVSIGPTIARTSRKGVAKTSSHSRSTVGVQSTSSTVSTPQRWAAFLRQCDDAWVVVDKVAAMSPPPRHSPFRLPLSTQFPRRFGPFFVPYRSGWRMYWYFVEAAVAAVGGLVAGVAYSQTDPCAAAEWTGAVLATLSVGMLLLHVVVRPCNARLDKVGAVLVGALAAASDVSAAAMTTDDVASAFTVAAAAMELLLVLVAMLCTLQQGPATVGVQREEQSRISNSASVGRRQHPTDTTAIVALRRPADHNTPTTPDVIVPSQLFLLTSRQERLAALVAAIAAQQKRLRKHST